MSEQNYENITFQIQRIYTKDISFKTEYTPNIFQQEWEPKVKLDLDISSSKLTNNTYEVNLCVTVNTNIADKTAFTCEVQQAGIFSIHSIEESQMAHFLGAYCPNILFPYARECITSLVSRGTFPQLTLAPVNFNALFTNYLQQHTTKNKNTINPQD